MTKFMVESFGYSVIEARDGYEALEEAREQQPDLILMDVAMPLMNGITSASLIRNSVECGKVPIVAVTAYGKEYLDQAEEFGFDQVVQKPVVLEQMKAILDKYLDDDGH